MTKQRNSRCDDARLEIKLMVDDEWPTGISFDVVGGKRMRRFIRVLLWGGRRFCCGAETDDRRADYRERDYE